jgi:hypothetical protein
MGRAKGVRNVDRWKKLGYGSGRGPDYKPWLTVRSFGSRGMAHRVLGHKTGRIHHFHSNHELGCFLLLEWNDNVTDIREQFPLHPVSETRRIAGHLGYRHPVQRWKWKGKWKQQPAVQTSDFRVTFSDKSPVAEMIISVKPSAELEKRRVLEKLQIERTYWERRSVEWQLVTEQELPQVMIDNLNLILPFRELDSTEVPEGNSESLSDELYRYVERSNRSLKAACREFEQELSLQAGTGLCLVWHAIATKKWSTDLSRPLNPSMQTTLVRKASSGGSSRKQELR